jgi:hypothetical protein
VLAQETMFGDELVGSKDVRLLRAPGEKSGLSFSGGMIAFAEVEGVPNAVTVTQARPLKIGEEPRLQVGMLARKGLPSPPVSPPVISAQPPAAATSGK